jgi:uncharacterized DUF497 family protein
MGFQWDPEKDIANQSKHGVSFRQAAEIFRGRVLVVRDTRRDYGETRFNALGVFDDTILRVVYAERNGDIRIISAWRAGKYDRETYRGKSQEAG